MLLIHDFPKSTAAKADLNKAMIGLEAEYSELDAVVLTSKDPNLSEYVPLDNNPRYGITLFTGSVGDAIYFTEKFRKTHPEQKPVVLFVDGRYHLQADQETNPELTEVVKLEVEPNIEGGVRARLSQYKGIQVGLDFERTSVASLARYEETAAAAGLKLVPLKGEAVLKALGLPGWKVNRPIFSLPEAATGRSLQKTLDALSKDLALQSGHEENLHFTVATDDAAFLMNARGFHLPHTGSFLAYTFFAGKELIVFLGASSQDCEVNLDPAQCGDYQVTVIRNSLPELKAALGKHRVKNLYFNGGAMNGLLPTLAKEVFPAASLKNDYVWLMKNRTKKTAEEMATIRAAFIRSSRAIAKTLRYGKSESQKRNFSETELASFLYEQYAEEKAVALSFSTISGAGDHSAIVHYSTPSSTSYFGKGELALLDSGAYYEEGFCTDCTRGFFVGGKGTDIKPEKWQKEIYTATLKAGIQVFMHPVDSSLSGKEVDALIRNQVKEKGYDYLHGTGHGVGIHVHEDGIRLSTLSPYPQSVHACVSVEPGIYLKGKGGVRIENIALLHPEGPNRLRYENVVFVGYDWDLIDVSQLTDEEKVYLRDYETQCQLLGTELMECPL